MTAKFSQIHHSLEQLDSKPVSELIGVSKEGESCLAGNPDLPTLHRAPPHGPLLESCQFLNPLVLLVLLDLLRLQLQQKAMREVMKKLVLDVHATTAPTIGGTQIPWHFMKSPARLWCLPDCGPATLFLHLCGNRIWQGNLIPLIITAGIWHRNNHDLSLEEEPRVESFQI